MMPWEVWQCPFPWGDHPAVIVSNEIRVARKQQIVVLACQTMRPQTCRDAQGLESLLDESDGIVREPPLGTQSRSPSDLSSDSPNFLFATTE